MSAAADLRGRTARVLGKARQRGAQARRRVTLARSTTGATLDEVATGTDWRVHRCAGCGAWLYGGQPCRTCALIDTREWGGGRR